MANFYPTNDDPDLSDENEERMDLEETYEMLMHALLPEFKGTPEERIAAFAKELQKLEFRQTTDRTPFYFSFTTRKGNVFFSSMEN